MHLVTYLKLRRYKYIDREPVWSPLGNNEIRRFRE